MSKIFVANITVISDSSYLSRLGFYSDYLQPMETTLFVFWSTRSVPLGSTLTESVELHFAHLV